MGEVIQKGDRKVKFEAPVICCIDWSTAAIPKKDELLHIAETTRRKQNLTEEIEQRVESVHQETICYLVHAWH